MAKSRTIVCADSCAFISLLDGGRHRSPADVSACRAFFDSVTEEGSSVHLIFPTMERAEILQCTLPEGAMDQFDLILDRPNIEEVSIVPAISTLAGEIRNYLFEAKAADKSLANLSTEDSIVVAAAIHHECESLYTYDGDREPPNKPRTLLGLGPTILKKYPLQIRKPRAEQMSLFSSP